MSDFIPTADNDLLVWSDHFLAQMSSDTEIAVTDLEALKAASADFHAKIAHLNDSNALAKQATIDKNASRNNTESLIRAEVRRIKARSTYSDGLGAQLNIVGTKNNHDLSTSIPELSGNDLADGVVAINFSKYNSDGVNIYSKRETDIDWQLLHRASVSPFMDVRPLLQLGKPELRRYSAVYVLKDKEIGSFSNEVVVNCTP